MIDEDNNLLKSLNKWAERQDENFVTDAFAHLLRHLLKNAPEAAVKILGHLTNGLLDLTAQECAAVEVTTQTTTESGRLDIKIRLCDRFLVYVEVKVRSPRAEGQLERYLHELKGSGVESTRLVFLTDFPEDVGDLAFDPDFCHARWYDVVARLRDAVMSSDDTVSAFLANQFVSFLREKGMTMEQVSRELVTGVHAVNHLLLMLGEVLGQCRLKIRREGDWSTSDDYRGFYCESKKYWVGSYFGEPQFVCFETVDNFRMAEGARERTDVGKFDYWEDDDIDSWEDRLDLSADGGEFFALSASEQAQQLKDFVQRCLATAKQIEAPSATARPVDAASSPE